jgi:hypothetical protein
MDWDIYSSFRDSLAQHEETENEAAHRIASELAAISELAQIVGDKCWSFPFESVDMLGLRLPNNPIYFWPVEVSLNPQDLAVKPVQGDYLVYLQGVYHTIAQIELERVSSGQPPPLGEIEIRKYWSLIESGPSKVVSDSFLTVSELIVIPPRSEWLILLSPTSSLQRDRRTASEDFALQERPLIEYSDGILSTPPTPIN